MWPWLAANELAAIVSGMLTVGGFVSTLASARRRRDAIATSNQGHLPPYRKETAMPYDIGDDLMGDDVLGDIELGDDVLGDDVLGDDVLGDDVLGDDVLGDDVLGDIEGDDVLGDIELGAASRRRRARKMRRVVRVARASQAKLAKLARKVKALTSGASRARLPSGASVRETPPDHERRFTLPLDSQVAIAAGATFAVAAQPQQVFRGERMVISSAIAASFLVLDVIIGTKSQLASQGAVSGDIFAPTSFGVTMEMDTAQIGQQVIVRVQNTSAGPLRFTGAIVGKLAY